MKIQILILFILFVATSVVSHSLQTTSILIHNQLAGALSSTSVSNIPLAMHCSHASMHGSHNRCAQSLSIRLSPNNVTLVRGFEARIEASANLSLASTASVVLSAQGVPAGASVTFAPASGRSPFSSVVTIATSNVTQLGRLNLTIDASSGALHTSTILFVHVVPLTRDLAVISAQAPTHATEGTVVRINATIENFGYAPENFELDLNANTTTVAQHQVITLLPHANYTTSLYWNTTGYSMGRYDLEILIPPISGVADLKSNHLQVGQLSLERTPNSQPSPSPAATGSGPGFIYGRALAIGAAIAEALLVALVFLSSRRKRFSKGKGL